MTYHTSSVEVYFTLIVAKLQYSITVMCYSNVFIVKYAVSEDYRYIAPTNWNGNSYNQNTCVHL